MGEIQKVAVGVFFCSDREQFLLAERKTPEKCYWEFPGGKQERGETTYQALCREWFEELGVSIHVAQHVMQLTHCPLEDAEKRVLLEVWRVHQFAGMPVGREGQRIQWVSPNGMEKIVLLPATRWFLDQVMSV